MPFFAMLALGLSPFGMNPIVSAQLYKKIVIPVALYGCELWNNMTTLEINTVDRLQHYIAKKIQYFGTRTRSDISESMLGLNRLSCLIEMRKLAFLHKLLCLDASSTSKNIFIRRYVMYITKDAPMQNGFIPDICNILCRYGLQTFINKVLIDPSELPTKAQWKHQIKRLVIGRENELWTQRMITDDEFSLFRILQPKISPAMVYRVCGRSAGRNIMHTIATIWSEPFKNSLCICHVCDCLYTDYVVHLVTECVSTSQLRWGFVSDVMQYEQNFTNDLFCMESLQYTLKLLGADIGVKLDEDTHFRFLRRAYKYIYDCVSLQS